MASEYTQREKAEERMHIVLPVSLKAKAFEAAAKEGVSVSALIRRGLAIVTSQAA